MTRSPWAACLRASRPCSKSSRRSLPPCLFTYPPIPFVPSLSLPYNSSLWPLLSPFSSSSHSLHYPQHHLVACLVSCRSLLLHLDAFDDTHTASIRNIFTLYPRHRQTLTRRLGEELIIHSWRLEGNRRWEQGYTGYWYTFDLDDNLSHPRHRFSDSLDLRLAPASHQPLIFIHPDHQSLSRVNSTTFKQEGAGRRHVPLRWADFRRLGHSALGR